jgi:hypothetical protein
VSRKERGKRRLKWAQGSKEKEKEKEKKKEKRD